MSSHDTPIISNDAKEKYSQKRKEYYRENSERVIARNKAYRDANKEKYSQKRKEYYRENSERIIARNKAYRDANKEKLKAKWDLDNKVKSEQKKVEAIKSLKELAEKYAPHRTLSMQERYTTRTEIAKHLGVKPSYIDSISRNDKYRMPRHKETNGDIYLYCRKEVAEWMPYAQEVLAFHKLGEKIPRKKDLYTFKVGSMVHGLITFMQNNRKLHLRNIDCRRGQRRVYAY
jgi:hypothetical protein